LFVAMLKGWMGAGDVKLMALCGAVAGAWAGWGFSLVVLAYVSVAGGIEALVFIVAARLRGLDRPKYVPYGLAIAAGAAAAFVFGAPGGCPIVPLSFFCIGWRHPMRPPILVAVLVAGAPALAQAEGGTIGRGVGQQKVIQVGSGARVAIGE